MEILATHTEVGGIYWLFWLIATIVFVISLNVITFAKSSKKLYGVVGLVLYFAITILGVYVSAYETYDVIVTDWNEVYEQGYEVVETNGKIVTLRKVDE